MLPKVASTFRRMKAQELRADVVIIGGGTGGFAAALAAARNGSSVILTEETDWIGGQLTQQAVPPDEHPWIESFGCTQSYRDFRNRIRGYYKENYPLTPAARADPALNPGNGSVSRLCFEPRVGVAVMESMLAPFISSGRVRLLLRHKAITAETNADHVKAVRVRDLTEGHEITLRGDYFIDATELGDLLPMTGTEYVTGAEAQKETGEMHAPEEAQPGNMQAITWCFAAEFCPGENHTIEKPANYEFWRDYVPEVTPAWPGKLLDWTYSHPITLEPRLLPFNPLAPNGGSGHTAGGLWTYRRIFDHQNHRDGFANGGVTLVNWPHNDYLLGNILDVGEEELARHLQGAQELSYSLLHWIQTEAPRADGGAGWPELRLRGDLTGTSHGLAKHPYVREARRIRAEFTVLEQHVGTRSRQEATGLKESEVTAERFADSVGLGCYRIDLHPSTGGDNYIDVSSLPFEIPLGALIPQRMENLLPAAKNLGVTHITNGCYRLHPVEWNIGEAAGALASYSLRKGKTPRQVRNQEEQLADFQACLQRDGVSIRWPKLRPV